MNYTKRFIVIGVAVVLMVSVVAHVIAASCEKETQAGSNGLGGDKPWATIDGVSNTDNVEDCDGVWATCHLKKNYESDFLIAQDFGFNIPATATIDGVVVRYVAKASGSGIHTQYVALVGAGGAVIGDPKNVEIPIWTTDTDGAQYSNGSFMDDWNAVLTPAIVNSSSFGFKIKCDNQSTSNKIASVDCMKIVVYYTP